MRKLYRDFGLATAALLLPTMMGNALAFGGETVRDDIQTRDAPTKVAEAVSPPAAPDAAPPRQHVKHLRAHKKIDAFAPDDSAQKPDSKNPPQNALSASAGKNPASENGADGQTAKAGAKQRVKIARPRIEKTVRERAAASSTEPRARSHDFISDIFGGDE